jgi:hypothetical protein
MGFNWAFKGLIRKHVEMYTMQAGMIFRTSIPDVDTKPTKTSNMIVRLSALLLEQMGRHINL